MISASQQAAAAAQSGTITFFFSDIEGSTRRWESDAAAMRRVLAQHDALMHHLLAEHGGRVFKTVGDGFYATFDLSAAAVAAAVDIQRAFHDAGPFEGEPLRVRVGIHTSARDEAEERDGDYFGPPLNRTARVMAAGHGGQVLVSSAAADAARSSLPRGVELHDLGEHRLKDLQRPERIYELRIAGLPTEHPPLRTLNARPNNLPTQATPFVGRERELAAAREQILRPDVRLLTFLGPGGVGKTRLSVQVAAEVSEAFPEGVHFVPLETIREPELLLPAIAAVVGVAESAERPLADVLAEQLRGDRLLVLDNFEQVVAGGPIIANLLRACPGLKVITTTREALRVYGEHEFRVPPLSLGDEAADAEHSDAIRLFVDRAHRIRPDFVLGHANAAAVAAICRRLDGLPLAIELAVARLRIFTPDALLARLDRRLPLLSVGSRDLPGRQQTLRGAIAWSYELLDDAERSVFRQLAAFAGGFTLEAAEEVVVSGGLAVVDAVDSLAGKSLLVQEDEADARFTFLQTIHEYAVEQLAASDEEAAVRGRHALYFLRLAEHREAEFRGPGQREWGERFEREHPNFRAALDFFQASARWEEAWRLAGSLYPFWLLRGHAVQARARLDRVLDASAATPDAQRSEARAKALHAAATVRSYAVDREGARRRYLESLAIRRAIEDKRGIVTSLNNLGNLARFDGEYAAADAMYDEALVLARQLGDEWAQSILLGNLGLLARMRGDYGRAGELYRTALDLARKLGDQRSVALALTGLGTTARDEGDFERARALTEESVAVRRQLGDRQGLVDSLSSLGTIEAHMGCAEQARRCYDECLSEARQLGNDRTLGVVLRDLGMLEIEAGDAPAAGRFLGEALGILAGLGERRHLARGIEALAGLRALEDQPEAAFALTAVATRLRQAIGAPCSPTEQARLDGWLARARQQLSPDEQAAAAGLGALMSVEDALREFAP